MKYMVERLKKLLAWRNNADSLAEAVKKVFPESEVYIIGGAAEGRITAVSDIDVVVILEEPPKNAMERATLLARVREEMERRGITDSYLYEIHILSRSEAQRLLEKARFLRIA